MDRTVVAMFDDVNGAQRAMEELLRNGFDRSDISVVRANQSGDYTSNTTTNAGDASGMAAGAGVGAALGGLAGLVVGLGALAIPGIGPIVAAGPLATTLAGAGIGAVAGGLIGALTDVGIPEEEAGYYAEGVRRGGTLLTVRASDNMVSRASEILNRFSPIDVTQRASEWRASGWSGYDSTQSSNMGNSGSYSGSSTSMGSTGTGMGSSGSMSGAGMTGSYSGRFEDFDYQGPHQKMEIVLLVPSAEKAYEELIFRNRNIPGGLATDTDGVMTFGTHDPDGVKIVFRQTD